MSNSKNNASSRLPYWQLLAIATAALVIYFVLLGRWQSTATAPTSEAAAPSTDSSAQLELSRQLTAPGESGVVPQEAATPARNWLLPALAFGMPLALGFLWGRRAMRAPAPDERQQQDCSQQAASMATDSVPDIEFAQPLAADDTPAPAIVLNGRDDSDRPDPPAIDAIDERLKTKDEVIEALETIVKENRDEWEERERQANESLRRISELEAELAIANRIISENDVSATSFVPEDTGVIKPEIMTRN